MSEKQDRESKRKREEGNISQLEDEINAFEKSKRVLRSPEQRRLKQQEERTRNIATTVKLSVTTEKEEIEDKTMEEIKKLLENLTLELKKNTTEIQGLKEEMRNREKKWEQEKCQLIKRITVLENFTEKCEKEKRRNNVIIKGIVAKQGNVTKQVEEFIERNMEIQTKVSEAYQTKGGIIAKIESWEIKKEIMKNKNKLKGSQVYIDADLTPKERQVQKELIAIAKEMKNKGNRVTIGYRKLTVNGEKYIWEDEENGVILARNLPGNSKN